MPEMTWDEALDIVIADTREHGDFASDAEALDYVLETLSLNQIVRYDLETDDHNDPLWRNATAYLIFIGEFEHPTADDLRELVRALSAKGDAQLTRLQELWVYQINHA